MRIIGIDPGPEKSAVVVCERSVIRWSNILSNHELAAMLSGYNNELGGGIVAIEMMQSFGMPVGKDVFETVFWVGRFFQAAFSMEISLMRVYRSEVKMFHCGNMRAKDSNIRQALIDRYGAPGTKKNPGPTYGLKADMWSAFAIATYAASQNEERRAV